MQFLVTQKPKRKFRDAYYSVVAVIEAKSAAEAVRLALAHSWLSGDSFARHDDYNKPTAEPLQLGKAYSI